MNHNTYVVNLTATAGVAFGFVLTFWFLKYLVVALSVAAIFKLVQGHNCRWCCLAGYELRWVWSSKLQGRRVRLSTQTRKVWWLRSPACIDTNSAANIEAVDAAGARVYRPTMRRYGYEATTTQGVAFGLALLCICFTCRWLRSPYKGNSDYILGAKADGTVFAYTTQGGWGPATAHGVAFGFRCCSCYLLESLWLRSPITSLSTKFHAVYETGKVTNQAGNQIATPSGAQGVAFGFDRLCQTD